MLYLTQLACNSAYIQKETLDFTFAGNPLLCIAIFVPITDVVIAAKL